MGRVFNFSAGPCTLPVAVLEKAAAEMTDYRGCGMSVMEMSHRSKEFQDIIDTAEARVRRVLSVPENYKVLFLQGGASSQFAMVPLNLRVGGKAAYLNTGVWSKKAVSEAKRYLDVDVVASSEEENFTRIPDFPEISSEYDYVHITSNNTILGTCYTDFPKTADVPLVADMSSNIASQAMDIGRFGLIYAGAQKNLGPSGVTLVIIRDDILAREPQASAPVMFQYKTHAEAGSMYNTPPCYAIYILGLVMQWLEDLGGIPAIEKMNREKAALLYDYIDQSSFYSSPVRVQDRSLMNVPFVLANADLDKEFLSEAGTAGLINLKGHRLVGGMRASIYNAMPLEGIQKLIEFMADFAKKRG